jgi:hypothetical protein
MSGKSLKFLIIFVYSHQAEFSPAGANVHSEEIAKMRFHNYEKRRRVKMLIIVEFLKEKGENIKGFSK